MQDKNTPSTNSDPATMAATSAAGKATQSDFVRKIADKIKNSENILIALSKDPSVDEIAAAIGLTLYLDNMGKHATAIYSGRTPDELSFLQPNETFEKNTDSLQDFIIALNKEKADHLRYKLEGEFVKVFVTPYKTRLTEDDLSFSYGDYNVDFVIAINVPAAANLDAALREHGRIMHDASAVNITTGDAGKFGEIEWSNPVASSLCEMVTELVFALQGDEETPLDNDIATALLTGIVAATDRFSNNRTNSDTLSLASKLMSMGADQQLISSNVRGNDIVHNDENLHEQDLEAMKKDKTKLEVYHDEEANTPENRTGLNAMQNPNPADPMNNASLNPFANLNEEDIIGTTSAPHRDPNLNPATEAALAFSSANTMDPATMVSATNNVTPEDVVVQPIIPGGANPAMNNNITQTNPMNDSPAPVGSSAANPQPAVAQMQIPTPAGTAAPETAPNNATLQIPTPASNPAPAPSNARSMVESAPAETMTRQFGTAIQPPAPSAKAEKNYAEMMAAALADHPAEEIAPIASVPTPAPATNPEASAMANPVAPSANVPATPEAPAAPAMEPVANPNEILPPPPAPSVNADMMPPVLPPVMGAPTNQ